MGIFISFEGGDGSGKGTQSRLLYDYLIQQGFNVGFESFPRYSSPAGKLIGHYLNGDYGHNLHPELASSLYSFDRLHAKSVIESYLNDPKGVFIADRFSDSNKGHQGGRLKTDKERTQFFIEQDNFEHVALGIPKPNKTILMPVPPVLAQQYIDKKASRSYTAKKRDIHEADTSHLQNAYDSYLLLSRHEPKRIILIDPVDKTGNAMRSIESIHNDILTALTPFLPTN